MSIPLILVVEDEIIISLAIRRKLAGLGYGGASAVASGEDALRFARENRPSLVLMDIRLEGRMDGIEAAKIIQQELNIPVVFMTGNSDEATLERARGVEPRGILIKPVLDRELEHSLGSVLGGA